MKKNIASYIFIAVIFLLILNSCGSSGLTAPGKPTALAPDPENPNKIEINWKAVDGADIYYVYRSTTEDGTYSNEGFSVTSEEVELGDGETELRYSFINAFEEGDGGTYWYGIKAASNSDITVESAMSPVVEASTYSGTWGAAKELGDAAQLKLVADNTNFWVVYSLGAGSDAISVQKYAEDQTDETDNPPKIWTSIASPGDTDGSVNGPYSIFLNGGELYTIFNDDGQAGKVSMKYYHDSSTTEAPSFAWEAVGAAGFNGAAATEISAVTVGFGGTIYSAFQEAGTPKLYKYNSTAEAWFDRSLIGDGFPVTISTVSLITHNNELYIGYEDPGSELYLKDYDDSVPELKPGGLVEAGDIEDGNAVFISGGGSLYAVYKIVSGAFEIEQLIDNIWIPLTNTTGKPDVKDNGGYGTLDAHWFNGYLYIFYIDSTDNKGWVKYYDEDEGWQNAQKNGGAAITGTVSLAGFQLASAGNTLYAGYIEDDKAYVRILK